MRWFREDDIRALALQVAGATTATVMPDDATVDTEAIIADVDRVIEEFRSEAVPPDEPIFVVRGKDQLASRVLKAYEFALRDRARVQSSSVEQAALYDQADEVLKARAEIVTFQSMNPKRVKMPDHKHEPVRV